MASKISVTIDKPETIDALKDNIREAIGEIQLDTIDNVLKNTLKRRRTQNESLFAADFGPET